MSRIGCHVSIAGGVINAPKRAADLGCEVFQIFTRSPQGGPAPKITPDVCIHFKSEMKRWQQKNFYIHTPYYINFASSNKAIRGSSVRVVREELDRGSLLGAKYVMTHMGSSKDLDRKEALKLTSDAIIKILNGYNGSTILLLEISAGAGHVLGNTFEELAEWLKPLDGKAGVCLDSAHMFAGGYDIKTKKGFDDVLVTIKKTIGFKRIKLIHANDSMVGLGEKKDRHEHIGYGKIGNDGFVNLMSTFKTLDFILETKHDKVEEDIKALKQIRSQIS